MARSDDPLGWVARQLRWERRLSELVAKADPAATPAESAGAQQESTGRDAAAGTDRRHPGTRDLPVAGLTAQL